MSETTEPSKFVSHRARMPGEFDSKKGLHSTKFKQNIKLSFGELCDSKLL